MQQLVQIMKPNFVHSDSRGSLTQLVREGYAQVNVITSNKGCFRGGHYHKLNQEAFYIITGELKLTVRKDDNVQEYVFKHGDMFMIPPFVIHDFNFTLDTTLVSMYDKGVELLNGEKDIYPG